MGDNGMLEAGDIRLAYQAWGSPDAPPLVLLHALGEGAADWDGVAPAFARHYRVYAPDLRGHGRSGWPGDYSAELMAGDVAGFLDGLGLGRVDLIGHSMGGLVAWLLAAERPERVRRLILEDVAAPLPRPRSIPDRPAGELPYDWDMVLAIRGQVDEPDPAWLERLRQVTAPTLVIGGGSRSHIPQERVAELARRIPGARHETIAAGHLIHDAEPQAFTQTALRFLQSEASMPDRESELLLTALNAQRDHVLGILDGLPDEALRRPALPSGWTCLGLVRHLALDVERFWFRGVMAGEPDGPDDPTGPAADGWQVSADVPAQAVLDLYRREVQQANAIIAATSVDAAPAAWPVEIFPTFRLDDLREIILHVITETACHAGHLDAARELIDGRRWLVLTS